MKWICDCGCGKPYDEVVRDVMRTMLLNREQASAIVGRKRAE